MRFTLSGQTLSYDPILDLHVLLQPDDTACGISEYVLIRLSDIAMFSCTNSTILHVFSSHHLEHMYLCIKPQRVNTRKLYLHNNSELIRLRLICRKSFLVRQGNQSQTLS